MLTTMADRSLPLTSHELEEFGDPDDPADLAALQALCPYQALGATRAGPLPPVLISAAVRDPRIGLGGLLKWAARARAKQGSADSPVLLRLRQAGHFVEAAELEDTAVEYAFLLQAMRQAA